MTDMKYEALLYKDAVLFCEIIAFGSIPRESTSLGLIEVSDLNIIFNITQSVIEDVIADFSEGTISTWYIQFSPEKGKKDVSFRGFPINLSVGTGTLIIKPTGRLL